ncbi:MAG TPA: hypothetical protein VNN10_13525 [Dehalococcoidia bacterium]|nr:hypothetical protein [Dehalococcoidia bacterium]
MNETELALSLLAGALAGAGTSLLSLLYKSAQDRRDRQREHFSKALQAVSQYEEFPYVVRRRRARDAEGERLRISTELRAIQSDLTYHCVWLMTESRYVGQAYEALVDASRRIAGKEINRSWGLPPIEQDSDMNIPDIGPRLADLRQFKEAYMREVADHLSIWPRWLRRLARRSR